MDGDLSGVAKCGPHQEGPHLRKSQPPSPHRCVRCTPRDNRVAIHVDARDEDFVDVNDNGGPRVATGGFDWKQYGLTQPPGAVDGPT